MKKKALLVIGDEKITKRRPYVSFAAFIEYAQRLAKKGKIELKVVSYAQLLTGKLPRLESSFIRIVFFFPYQYWNREIEIYPDGRIYGDKDFGRQFKAFFRKVKSIIYSSYRHKKIKYLNPPEACYLDRDKQASKDLLNKNAVPTPRTIKASSFRDVQRLIDKGLRLYIKPRFGSMGKGITYIDKEKVISNFIFRKGEVLSRLGDFNWRCTRIKDRQGFIEQLLKKGFICEEAIESAVLKKRRFDFRIYVMFGRVVYLYAKSSPVGSLVTNWSQGGRIDKRKTILRSIAKEKITRVERLAKRAARAQKLNFAGIDVIFSKGLKRAYVLEGNAFPGYEKGFDLMKCLLEYLVK
ncbi:MAG: hypothetical protein NG712_02000 [Omnitrophica bacterium]|nr:hypothetical protein [Candidatus Omnitrophota bacterium]